MTQYCPNCGGQAMSGDEFCGDCGAPLDTGSDERRSDAGGESDGSGQSQRTGRGAGEGTGYSGDRQDADWGEEPQGATQGQGVRPAPPVDIPRKNAAETFGQGLRWLLGLPILLGTFLLVDLVDVVSEVSSALVSLVGFLLTLVAWGVAYRYTELLVTDEQTHGDGNELVGIAAEVAGRLLSMIGIFLVWVILVFFGLLLLIVPGIYLGARLILAFPACVLDEQGAFESIATSWEVAGGNVTKLVGIFVIQILTLFVPSLVVSVFGGVEFASNLVLLAAATPVTAVLAGTVQMSIARVYLENRETEAPNRTGGRHGGQHEPTEW